MTATPYPFSELHTYGPQRTRRGAELLQIAFPLGGMGAGSLSLNGHGGLQDFAIRNTPALSALPDGTQPPDAAFALLRIPAAGLTRLVEGPLPVEKIYNQGLKAQGFTAGGYEGLPRFRECSFRGEFPIATVELSDPAVPLRVTLTAWSPFIPLDDRASSLPCALLEYRLDNPTTAAVEYEFSYHLSHLASGSDFYQAPLARSEVLPALGVRFYNEEDPGAPAFGSAALAVLGHEPVIKAAWLRGGWFDSISALWREVATGAFHPNDGTNPSGATGRCGGSILLAGRLEPGQSITYPILITWHFPNVYYRAGWNTTQADVTTASGVQTCACGSGCDCTRPFWRPYYVSQWPDAAAVAHTVAEDYASLRARTWAFHGALFASTLPDYILEAVSANLAILKSPTVLREENGALWGWEGCHPDHGCCYGSCTHVWNYAQAIPHLFPALERGLREQELQRSMDERGHVNFRAALPAASTHHVFHAAADGQLGGILKVYREWRISGDRGWLEKMYPLARQSMDYCIETWDPRRRGVLEEPHHNTYDIEFWGPDGMCSSFYLGALAAMAALAREAGQSEEALAYEQLARTGALHLDERLFNGEYYEQDVTWEGLRDASFAETLAQAGPGEEADLLRSEGPRYQYGRGCISDGVLGAWLAHLCGIETPQDHAHVRSNLAAIFAHNFKPSLWEHANTQRPGFAIGDEPGLLLCTWPRGGKPTLPFVYSDEVWTGIEYQVASHLILEGLVDEGLTLVKALRSRYDGRARNPWNEYECGSFYARAMASYALLEALSGFQYDAARRELKFAPRLSLDEFAVFFSTAGGWGMARQRAEELEIEIYAGELVIDTLIVWRKNTLVHLSPGVTARPGAPACIRLPS